MRLLAGIVTLAVAVLGACSPAGDAPPSEAPALRRGELLSFACQACHALGADGGPDIGPSLYGVFGRPAGQVSDFTYSDALAAADFIWTTEQLDAWLRAPGEFLPGTTMVFAGFADPADRAALIDYLVAATARPSGEQSGPASAP